MSLVGQDLRVLPGEAEMVRGRRQSSCPCMLASESVEPREAGDVGRGTGEAVSALSQQGWFVDERPFPSAHRSDSI